MIQTIRHDQNAQNICIYRDAKNAEINIIKSNIKSEKEFIQKVEQILPRITDKERTSKEFRGMISIKQRQIDCNENLIKFIEGISDCV